MQVCGDRVNPQPMGRLQATAFSVGRSLRPGQVGNAVRSCGLIENGSGVRGVADFVAGGISPQRGSGGVLLESEGRASGEVEVVMVGHQ